VHGKRGKGTSVNDIRFDTNNSQRFVTCSEDHTLRIWKTSTDRQQQGIYLTNEHKLHRKAVKAADWDIHNSDAITSAGADHTIVCCSLSEMVQVQEFEKDGELIVCIFVVVTIS
jgi:WD40 repeat protein